MFFEMESSKYNANNFCEGMALSILFSMAAVIWGANMLFSCARLVCDSIIGLELNVSDCNEL